MASRQMQANGSYVVASDAQDTVVLTLPANTALKVGDRLRVSGQGSAPWQLAQNDGQAIVTTNLPGNVTPGTVWTARDADATAPAQNWFATAMSASGNELVAVSNPGGIYRSSDGGATWSRSNAPQAYWSSVAMSSDSMRLAAVATSGLLYTSSDQGRTWTARTATAQPWRGVYLPDDGRRIVAVASGQAIQVSTDGGASFSAVPATEGADWRAVAGSRDGMRLVSVASLYMGTPEQQGVYVSTDGGSTWTRRLGNGNWSFAAASADGMRMAAIDNGAYIHMSDDGGQTWRRPFSYSNWSGLAISGDGQVAGALEPRDDSRNYHGWVFLSTTGGLDPWSWNAGSLDLWWRGLSLSHDGSRIVVADTGANGSGGRIYTSSGNRTTEGSAGTIVGGQGQVLELEYLGNGRFGVASHEGGPFTIR